MADPHVGSPVVWAKRYINTAKLSEDDRRHVIHWADKFLENITQDPRHQAVALNVLCDYADLIAVRSLTRTTAPHTELHRQLSEQASRISTRLMKWLRLSVLRTSGKNATSTNGKGEIFTAPRDKRASEILASQPPGLTGDAA